MPRPDTALDEMILLRDHLEDEIVDEVVTEVMALSDSEVEQATVARRLVPPMGSRTGPSPVTVPAWLDPLRDLVGGFIRRQAAVFAISAAISASIAAAYLVVVPPTFTAHALLRLDAAPAPAAGRSENDGPGLESAIAMLKSPAVGFIVIRDLHLGHDVSPQGGGLERADMPLDLAAASSIKPSEALSIAREDLKEFERHLQVARADIRDILDISFRSGSRERAAAVANAVADLYDIESGSADHSGMAGRLSRRIAVFRDRLESAERLAAELAGRQSDPPVFGADDDRMIGELNSALLTARAQAAEARARLDRFRQIVAANEGAGRFDGHASTLSGNEVIDKLRAQYRDLAAREADWATRYGNAHLAVVNMRNQMAEIRAAILQEMRRLEESYQSDYEIAKTRADALAQSLTQLVAKRQAADVAGARVKAGAAAVQAGREIFDAFLAPYAEVVPQPSVIVARASPTLAERHPDIASMLGLAAGAALLLGMALGLLREARRPAAGPTATR
jgi:succinoglycan biosynthesis transport protein ExoP